MSSAAPAFPLPDYGALRIPAAAFELLFYLAAVAAATLCFLAGWLPVNGAVILTVILLTTLIVMSWINLGQGRHPVFLFLCTLTLFQGGRLLAYCVGDISSPLTVVLMVDRPFSLTRDEAGIVLLCIALSAVCVYAPCRLMYRPFPPPRVGQFDRYLPYLYLVFFCSVPFLVIKNYLYLRYVQQHGGYTAFFNDYAGLTANVPVIVRVLSIVALPVFTVLFVLETRKKYLWLISLVYFAGAFLYLLTGSRMDTFSLTLTLWYVARVKSSKASRILVIAIVSVALILVSNIIQLIRNDESDEITNRAPAFVTFVREQGISINVTEVAVKYRERFSPHIAQYIVREAQSKFVSNDVTNYKWGEQWSLDVSVLLNANLFQFGLGTGGDYLAEEYIFGGLFGVVVLSLVVGLGLRQLQFLSRNSTTLLIVAFILPDIVMLPRGGLFVWISTLAKVSLVAVPVVSGWYLYLLLCGIAGPPRPHLASAE